MCTLFIDRRYCTIVVSVCPRPDRQAWVIVPDWGIKTWCGWEKITMVRVEKQLVKKKNAPGGVYGGPTELWYVECTGCPGIVYIQLPGSADMPVFVHSPVGGAGWGWGFSHNYHLSIHYGLRFFPTTLYPLILPLFPYGRSSKNVFFFLFFFNAIAIMWCC